MDRRRAGTARLYNGAAAGKTSRSIGCFASVDLQQLPSVVGIRRSAVCIGACSAGGRLRRGAHVLRGHVLRTRAGRGVVLTGEVSAVIVRWGEPRARTPLGAGGHTEGCALLLRKLVARAAKQVIRNVAGHWRERRAHDTHGAQVRADERGRRAHRRALPPPCDQRLDTDDAKVTRSKPMEMQPSAGVAWLCRVSTRRPTRRAGPLAPPSFAGPCALPRDASRRRASGSIRSADWGGLPAWHCRRQRIRTAVTAWEERNPNEYFCFGAKQYLALGMQTRFIAAGLGLSALALVLVVATTRCARFLCGWLRELLVFSGGHCLRLEMGMRCTRL